MACPSQSCGCGDDGRVEPAKTRRALVVPPPMRSPFGPEALPAALSEAKNANTAGRLAAEDARLAAIAAQRGRPVAMGARPVAGRVAPQLARPPVPSNPFAVQPIVVERAGPPPLPARQVPAAQSPTRADSPMQVSTVQPAPARTPPQPLPLPPCPGRLGLEALNAGFANVRAPRPQPVSAEKLAASLGVGGVVAATARPAGAAPVLSPGAAWRAGMQGRGIQPARSGFTSLLDARTAASAAALLGREIVGGGRAGRSIDASVARILETAPSIWVPDEPEPCGTQAPGRKGAGPAPDEPWRCGTPMPWPRSPDGWRPRPTAPWEVDPRPPQDPAASPPSKPGRCFFHSTFAEVVHIRQNCSIRLGALITNNRSEFQIAPMPAGEPIVNWIANSLDMLSCDRLFPAPDTFRAVRSANPAFKAFIFADPDGMLLNDTLVDENGSYSRGRDLGTSVRHPCLVSDC